MSAIASPSGAGGVGDRNDGHHPLGYLVKRLDEALTNYVDRLLGERHQLGRSHWQLLRTVHNQPGMKRSDFADSARIFYDEEKLRTLIDDLTRRGWLLVEDSDLGALLRLTDEGERGFAHMARTQDSSWARLLEGLTEDDYKLVLTRLEQMIANLERS